MRLPRGLGVKLVLVLSVAGIAGFLAATSLGTHAGQRWAGQWDFEHLDASGFPNGVTGGFAFRHETDAYGAELLQLIGGTVCAEPTDYFAGGYTVPDGTTPPPALPPGEFIDTGKIRACVVGGDPLHIRGRYQSNQSGGVSGDIDLTLNSSGTAWTGTFTTDGQSGVFAWQGTFDKHFEDGADDPSDPPYGSETTTDTGTTTGGTTTTDDGQPEDGSEEPETATVILKGKQFQPSEVTLTNSDILKICNRDPFYHRPFSINVLNRFTQLLKPKKCVTRIMRNPNAEPIAVGIFDDFHAQEKLIVVVLPGGLPEQTFVGPLPSPPVDNPNEIEVRFEERRFKPSLATAKNGSTLVLCNLDLTVGRPFSFSRYNGFEAKLQPGKCLRRRLRNPSNARISMKVFDDRFSGERARLEIAILAD